LNIIEYKVIIKLVLKQLQNIRNTVTIFSVEILSYNFDEIRYSNEKKRFFFCILKNINRRPIKRFEITSYLHIILFLRT